MSVQRISFEITNACNLNCIHCLRDNSAKKSYLPVEYLDKICVQAKRYGTLVFILTGGEPLLHPQLEEMVDRIVHHGYAWYIVTNATLLDRLVRLVTHPERRKKLLFVSVSLDGATEEVDDYIRGEGHYRQMMKALTYMRAKGVPMGFKTSINTRNVVEMEDIVNLSSKIGASFVEFSHMTPTPGLIQEKLILPMDRWQAVDEEIFRLRKIYNLMLNTCAGSRCDLTFTQCHAMTMHDIHFDFYGNMSACCMLPNYRGSDPTDNKDIAGNIKDKDFWDLHSKLMGILAGINRAKLKKIKNNTMTKADYYPCVFCLKHFGKLEWLKEMDPQNEWIVEDVEEKA